MIDRIRQLESIACQLEPDNEHRALLTEKVINYAQTFIEETTGGPAYTLTEDNGRGLYEAPISEEGIDIDTALSLLEQNVDRPGLNPTSGRFLGYIPGGGLYPAALGDYLAAITNRYAGIFFASPGAVRMENMLLKWMARVIGYPKNSAGNLTSGGSIASLIGIVTARDAYGLEGHGINQAVVYFTEHMHHALDKALRIAGLKNCIKRLIPVDHHYRMDVTALDQAIVNDRTAGLQPWLIIASAGTTNTGSVDPLAAIAEIAAARKLWFHIDGAYGAFFTLCEPGRKILAGMDKSDSIVMDPHKTLFLPYGTGAVLVRNRQLVYESHHYEADYMQDILTAVEEASPADFSPELTKHFRGLRVWLPLKLFGVAPFRAALEEKMLLARYFHQKIQQVAAFEVGPPPDLGVTIYRYLPKRGDANEFNQRLVQELHRDGRIFVSSTIVNGKFVLRLAVGAYRTHLDDIEQTLEVITEKAAVLAAKA